MEERNYKTERWTSKELLGFSGSRNWYVYAGNDEVNFVDLDGRKTILIIVRDFGMLKIGVHAALYIDDNGYGESILYDPNGGWNPKDGDGGPLRGVGDYFINPDMNDYYNYHTKDGTSIDKLITETSLYDEKEIWDSIKRYEDNNFDNTLDCSISVSNVLSETNYFRGFEKNIFFPGNLIRHVKYLINRKDRVPYLPQRFTCAELQKKI